MLIFNKNDIYKYTTYYCTLRHSILYTDNCNHNPQFNAAEY